MRARSTYARTAAAFAGAGAGLALAAPATAAPAGLAWTCSASAASVGAGGGQLAPLHANIDPDAPCRDDGAAAPALLINDALGLNTVTARSATASAITALANPGGPTTRQLAGGSAGIEDLVLNVGGQSLTVTAKAIVSQVGGRCAGEVPQTATAAGVSGTPTFASNGSVVDLRINGVAVPSEGQPDGVVDQVANGISPLAPIIRVLVNKEYRTGGPATTDESLTREAVRIELLSAAGSAPLATVVLGRATAGRHGSTCALSPAQLAGGSSSAGGTGSGSGSSSGSGSASGQGTAGAGSGSTNANAARPNGTNASSCARLRLFWVPLNRRGIAKTGPKSTRSRFGLRRVLRGNLRSCGDKAIVGARVEVLHYVRGNLKRIKTGMRSRPGGRLTLILPLDIRSRRIVGLYRPAINRSRVASSQTLRITIVNRRGRVMR